MQGRRLNMNRFKGLLEEKGVVLLDGGMGTMLQAAGMPAGVPPEKFCLANQDVLRNIHREYLKAGANIITTCTFGASSFKLPRNMDVRETNRALARIACACTEEAGADRLLAVGGDVGPSGFFARPLGDVEPEILIAAFEEQIRGLVEGGVDFIFMETQFDLAEIRAAIIACRRVCSLPVMASMTFEDGRCLTGSTPEIFAETMLNMGIQAVGTNCSLGPEEMKPVVETMLDVCPAPVMAEPNAGLPQLVEGRTIFPLGPEEFASKTAVFAEMGVKVLGGCCGTTPAHISALRKKVDSIILPARHLPQFRGITLTSRTEMLCIGRSEPLVIIGERINPTGKPKLADQLREGNLSLALQMADEQLAKGAKALDVNVGAPLVDETILLPKLVCALIERTQAPLSLDSAEAKAIEAALPFWPGSCLVNSISGEKNRMEELGPICRDSGSPFILLPLAGGELPVYARDRIAIAERLLLEAAELGIPQRLILVDILALAVSSAPDAGRECLYMADWCAEKGLPASIGLSNISFGLPARALLNSVFLAMARGAGLACCIANPGVETLRQTVDAIGTLEGYKGATDIFIDAYRDWKPGEAVNTASKEETKPKSLYDCVLLGDRENIEQILEEELASGKDPFDLVNAVLVPAINEVGERYARKEYFLPQLIRSAETMKAAFARLTPLLKKSGGAEKKPVIVMATVEGDIHDIGKNIVSLLLGNHGFEVIDAGKDVPAAEIVECAIRNSADVIGLSALMTTTMTRMKDTIQLLKEKKLPIKVMVGGAAVTQAFADSIGADRYCETAVDSVAAAREFTAAV